MGRRTRCILQSSRAGVNRTLNRSFWRRVLYQLSYGPVSRGRESGVSCSTDKGRIAGLEIAPTVPF